MKYRPKLVELLFITAAVALLAGCHSDRGSVMGPPPNLPAILQGPGGLLLAESGSFTSEVELNTESVSNSVKTTTGKVFSNGNNLWYAPDEKEKKRAHPGFSFIWNARTGSGYLLCEALQGYAPIYSNIRFTNLVVRPIPQGSQPTRMEGHPVIAVEVMGIADDVSVATVTALRAPDLNNFPLQLRSETTPATARFFKVRLEHPPTEAFSPPAGFTKYASGDALVNEISARQGAVRSERDNDRDRNRDGDGDSSPPAKRPVRSGI